MDMMNRAALPLPSAALIVDLRGTGDDDNDNMMDRLRIEVADLVSEMKVQGIHHWRFLTDFLSFRTLSPLQPSDLEAIRVRNDPEKSQQVPPKGSPTFNQGASLTGYIDRGNQGIGTSSFQDTQGLISGGRPFDIFQQHIEEMTQEIDRIRNNRIAAQTDLNKGGVTGHTVRDATVRVIFLTNSESSESLSSASAYAAHLKAHFSKLERQGYQSLMSVTVICLDTSSEGGPPEELVKGLRWEDRWDHLDSLIISEKYSDNSALISGAMQTYLAELLLYVLLIIPPLRVNSAMFTDVENVRLLETKENHEVEGEWVMLPGNTFLVGLTAVEHSARWGRRWLNYGLVTNAVDILQNKVAEDEPEHRRIKSIIAVWLSDWRSHITAAIPDKIPGNIQALNALPQAREIAHQGSEVFITRRFNFDIGKMTIDDLETYLTRVKRAYAISPGERPMVRKRAEAIAQSSDVRLDATLQDAVDSIPLIQQRLREWEVKDPALKKGTPLVKAQFEAQTILSDPNFFGGALGAVPRARLQLRELSTAISDFDNTYQQTKLDLMGKRAKVESDGNKLIDSLKSHVERIPFLANVLHLATPMLWLTPLLAFCLIFFAVLLGLTWLTHLVVLHWPDSTFLSIMNDALNLGAAPPLAYVVWIAIAAVILTVVVFLFRNIVRPLSTFGLELFFWFSLIVFAVVGLLFGFSFNGLANDPLSLSLLAWLAPLPFWAAIVFVVALLIAVIEVVWFWVWYTYLMDKREQIVRDLGQQMEKDVDEVRRFIADSIALQLLQRAGLTDGMGGPGPYYHRVDQLYRRLSDVSREANHQRNMAANRLLLSLSELQPGAGSSGGPWLNLKIREEWLDAETLADGYKRLISYMTKEAEELKEFSEMLVRMMGEEVPIEIEQQFREKSFTGSREQRQAQVLMTTLATLVLRFLISAQSVDAMTPIIDRYENLDNQYIYQLPALNSLISTLRRRVSKATLQPLYGTTGANTASQVSTSDHTQENILLATDGFATWAQLLWERRGEKNDKLNNALVQDGVLPKLLSDGYDPRAVMRRLYVRTSLFGRPIQAGQPGEAYLLLSPSPQSRTFRQQLNIPPRLIIDFPDTERLLLLYIQQYIAKPLFVPTAKRNGAAAKQAAPEIIITEQMDDTDEQEEAESQAATPDTK